MTLTQARAQASREISRPYRTAANRSTITYGLSAKRAGGYREQTDVGTYRDALAARREWIEQRAAELVELAIP